jgi:ABC-2 type transport system ATP-binding protein
MNDFAIEIKSLTKHYGSLVAVNELSLFVPQGVIFGFLGPNGAGKTTTIRMLLGLLKPTEGSASLLGWDILTQRNKILSQIGAIVETPTFYPYLSGRDNLRELALVSGLPFKKVEEVLELVELKEAATAKVKTYSLGMKQRLGLAAALLNNPRLIFLDEPTNGLDPQGTVEMRKLILRLAENNHTIFLSSHLLNEVEQLCSQVAIINKGQLVVEGLVQELIVGHSQIILEVSPAKPAVELLRVALSDHQAVQEGPDRVKTGLVREQLPAAIRLLANSGLDIYGVYYQKPSLEDYFLAITDSGVAV